MRFLMKLLPALAVGAALAGAPPAEAKGPGLVVPEAGIAIVPVDGRRWDRYDGWDRRGPPPGRGWRRDHVPYGYWAPPPRVYYPPPVVYAPPRAYYAPPPPPVFYAPAPRYYYPPPPPPPPGIGLYFRF